jgi:pimeloyl-ACP methyl ester carboxylesterase
VEASADHPSFDVVALSLPGYGFSEAPKKKGFILDQYAEVYHHYNMHKESSAGYMFAGWA